jgi:hypothetical protein
MKYFLAFTLASRVFSAEPGRPDWINGSSPSYPKSAYLTGVGQGPTMEKAADKARAELAKGLSLSLEASSSQSASETSDGTSSSYSQRVSDEVRTSTVKVLDGAEIAQTWQGPDGFYALAVLDRAHSLKILRDKLDELDRDFADLGSEFSKAEGKFARLKAALRLVKLSRDRRRVNSDYRILNPEGKGVPAPASSSEVTAQARKAAAALTFQVSVTGPRGERLTTRMIDALGACGLRAVEKGAKTVDVVIEATAHGELLPAENLTWRWARGEVEVKMSYGSTGEVFARFSEAGREASRDPGSAVDATLRALVEKAALRAFKAVLSADLADD